MPDDLISKTQDALQDAGALLEPWLADPRLSEADRQAARQVYLELKNWQFKFLDLRPEQLTDADRSRLQDFLEKAQQNRNAVNSANLAGGSQDFSTAIDRYRQALSNLMSVDTHGSGEGEP